MDFWTYGVDIATMATGLSALTAASVGTWGRWCGFLRYRSEKKERVWNAGYIMMEAIQSWSSRLADDDGPTAGCRCPGERLFSSAGA
jgi:hypothetical protein